MLLMDNLRVEPDCRGRLLARSMNRDCCDRVGLEEVGGHAAQSPTSRPVVRDHGRFLGSFSGIPASILPDEVRPDVGRLRVVPPPRRAKTEIRSRRRRAR